MQRPFSKKDGVMEKAENVLISCVIGKWAGDKKLNF